MSDKIQIVSPNVERTVIPFDLDGVEYEFKAPKQHTIISAMFAAEGGVQRVQGVYKILQSGLSKKDWTAIQKRLDDPDDGLDVETMDTLLTALLREASGRPTSSASD